MNQEDILKASTKYVRGLCENHESGHDWWHIVRVTNLSRNIARSESCDAFIVELAALFHDIADTKFNEHKDEDAGILIQQFLSSINLDDDTIQKVIYVVDHVSFRKSFDSDFNMTQELAVVMDADRLDAIGAIGIARAFSFGGHKQRAFYDPDLQANTEMTSEEYQKRNSTTINHFYEKLLLLKGRMNTNTGRELAEERHQFMELYLQRFYDEWEGLASTGSANGSTSSGIGSAGSGQG